MGYYVDGSGWIKFHSAEDKAKADRAVRDLNKHDHLKDGGSWSGGKTVAKWFSWMPEDYDKSCETIEDIFRELGFEISPMATGEGLVGLGWEVWYDSKMGHEELFLQTIAPYASFGIEWRGEDGALWRSESDGTSYTERTGRVVYE